MKTARAEGFLGMYQGGLIMHPWGKPGLGQVRTEGAAQGTRLCGFLEHWEVALLLPRAWARVFLSHICF